MLWLVKSAEAHGLMMITGVDCKDTFRKFLNGWVVGRIEVETIIDTFTNWVERLVGRKTVDEETNAIKW